MFHSIIDLISKMFYLVLGITLLLALDMRDDTCVGLLAYGIATLCRLKKLFMTLLTHQF